MKHRVEITATALQEVEEAFDWMATRSPAATGRWRDAIMETISTLESLPSRCPIASESGTSGKELREFLHGQRTGVYRILFAIEGTNVFVLRVRHAARRSLTEE